MWKLIFILVFSFSPFVYSSDLGFSRNARTFEFQSSSLVTKGVAHACLTLRDIPDGLPCNPAMTALNMKPSLGVEGLLSNGQEAISIVNDLLDGKISEEMMRNFLHGGRIFQIESNLELKFQSSALSAKFTPMTTKAFLVVRNETNPDMELYAVRDRSFLLQSGLSLSENLYSGIQIRLIDREFIRQRFKLFDLALEEGVEILRPNRQKITFVEPGIVYFFSGSWDPRVSLHLINFGFFSEIYQEVYEPLELQYGIGFSPIVPWGKLDISVEYRSMNFEEDTLGKLRVGAIYHMGSMYLVSGIDVNGISGGVFYTMNELRAGVLYATTQLPFFKKDFYSQTVYVQVGWEL